MDFETNRAIALYRSLKLKEWDAELQERELHARVSKMSREQFMAYANATQGIDAAMDETQQVINHNRYAYSTMKNMMHAAANRTGRDREKV